VVEGVQGSSHEPPRAWLCRGFHATLGTHRGQNSLTVRRFILNSLTVQKPHHHQTEFDEKALNLQGFYSFCNFFL
jgi:hypothetical protein